MLHFQLPRSNPKLYNNISINMKTENDEEENVKHTEYASSSLSFYLKDIKKRIDHQEQKWDIYKRYTNPYEYIHTNIPEKKKMCFKI